MASVQPGRTGAGGSPGASGLAFRRRARPGATAGGHQGGGGACRSCGDRPAHPAGAVAIRHGEGDRQRPRVGAAVRGARGFSLAVRRGQHERQDAGGCPGRSWRGAGAACWRTVSRRWYGRGWRAWIASRRTGCGCAPRRGRRRFAAIRRWRNAGARRSRRLPTCVRGSKPIPGRPVASKPRRASVRPKSVSGGCARRWR